MEKLIDLKKYKKDETLLKMPYAIKSISRKDVAIIGMAGRFGSADNCMEFWEGLREGKDFVCDIPEERKRDCEVYKRALEDMGMTSSELEYFKAAFLKKIDNFDCSIFNISSKEADLMDPHHRFFLEAAWEAIEDAGYGGGKLTGSRTGVFVGHSSDFGEEYKNYGKTLLNTMDELAVTGNIRSVMGSRISYILDLKGPSITYDTACSSALVAVHNACRALRNNECDMVLAGAAKISIFPMGYSNGQGNIGIESKSHRSRTFDDSSDGIGFGEGAGVVVLKPLNKAIDDGDHIYAVIKGSAVNQDGASIGITAPNMAAQEEVILRAWKDADIDPETITYIETHGTGTKLGDPIEIAGIQKAFENYTGNKQFCAVASVKTNIGHLDNAAGIASLIKATLALKNGELPPTIHFNSPNRKILFEDSPVYVNDKLSKWETGRFPRRCGISSFGLSGTNCHLVLEEHNDGNRVSMKAEQGCSKPEVLALSAKNRETLKVLVERYNEYLEDNDESTSSICYTANTGRGHYNCRIALVILSAEDLRNKINILMKNNWGDTKQSGIIYGEHKIVSPVKKSRTDGEITDEEKRLLSTEASNVIDGITSESDAAAYVSSLERLCGLYVRGADVEWERLYAVPGRKKASLPVYPFLKERHWIEPRKLPANTGRHIEKGNMGHPLLDDCLAESMGMEIYSTMFSVDRNWVLSEHRVAGSYVVPGTAYIEMAREIAARNNSGSAVEMRDVIFITPLAVPEGVEVEVQTIVRDEDEFNEFTIAGKSADGEVWTRHVEGKFSIIYEEKPARFDIGKLKSRFERIEEIGEIEDIPGGVETGIRFKNLRRAYLGENEVLAYLELPGEFTDDLKEYSLHPALMDTAVNMANWTVGEGLYLPLAYKKLKIFGKMPAKIYSYMKIKSERGKGSPETGVFDIVIMDEEGNVCAAAENYTVKKAHDAEMKALGKSPGKIGFYETGWIEKPLYGSSTGLKDGHILVFKGSGAIGGSIVHKLRSKDREVFEIEIGGRFEKLDRYKYTITGSEDDYGRLLSCIPGKYSYIIHTLAADGEERINSMEDLDEAQKRGIYSLFYLTKALVYSKKTDLDLILVCDYANEVSKDECVINPHNSALFALGKVLTKEYEELGCKCIDIDENTSAEAVMDEMQEAGKNRHSAYRSGIRYMEEFREVNLDKIDVSGIGFKAEGIYVITGGAGGIGLETAKYIASKERVNLCFINRSPLPEREEWESVLKKGEDKKLCKKLKDIMEIEDSGSKVDYYSADISNESAVNAIFEELWGKYGRVNGIVHAAGVAGDGLILTKNESAFRSVTAPKINGTWILDKLTEKDNPDFFIMFSSISSIMSAPGQGDYSAANAYMDAFTFYRSRKGKRSLAVNWPAWKETGMAVDFGVNKDGIFKTISTADALNAFEEILDMDMRRVIIAEPDYEHEAFRDESALPFHVSRKILSSAKRFGRRTGESGKNRTVKQGVEVRLKGRENGIYSGTERTIAAIWSRLLDIEEIDIHDDFFAMGGNSILSIKLEAEMEKNGLPIEFNDISSYPTVFELADFLDGKAKSLRSGSQMETELHLTGETNLTKEKHYNTLENVEPFNDIIYRGCFYSAFFPVVQHYAMSILPYMVNEISMYDYKDYDSAKSFNVDYVQARPLKELSGELGIDIKTKLYSGNLTEDIAAAISANRPVIVCIDAFYESIRQDTYMKTHWPHCLFVYGMNENDRTFNILEHRSSGSLVYEKRTISFSDLLNSYNGFIDNFRGVDITESEFGYIRVHDNKSFDTYFEFVLKENAQHDSPEACLKNLAANMSKLKGDIYRSLEYLTEFSSQFESVALNEQTLKERAHAVINVLNSVINAKQAESYRNSRVNLSETVGIMQEIIDSLVFVRTMVVKVMYTSRYNVETFTQCVEKLNKVCQLERRYYDKMYALLGDML